MCDVRVRTIYRIEDGQLAEGWFVEGNTDTLQQLGLWEELAV